MLLLFADFVLAIQGQQFLLMYLLLLFPLYHSIPTLFSAVQQSPFNGTAIVVLLIVLQISFANVIIEQRS